jgi:predicted ArsR family transcriptional regulator
MSKTKLDKRFFESTRGQIVLLLRNSNKTVNDLAAALNLTDNAVRAHLLTLEQRPFGETERNCQKLSQTAIYIRFDR